jgi:hypothetical protein
MTKVWFPFQLLLPLALAACSGKNPSPGFATTDTTQGTDGADAGDDGAAAASSADPGQGSTGPSGSSGGSSGTVTSNSGVTSGSTGGTGDGGIVSVPVDSGTGGVATIQTVDIQVPANTELVKCQNFKNPFGKDVALLETDSTMVSSHHMFLFHDPSFNMDTNSAADCSGIEFHDLVHLSQTPKQTIAYPEGVGMSLKATDGLRILVHLLNAGSEPVTAHVSISMHAVDPSQVQTLAVALFLNNAVLVVPQGMSTQSRTFTVPSDIKVMLAVSHMHSRAISFSATTNSGQTIYKGTSWNEPIPQQYAPAMSVASGSIITWACTYNNTTGQTLTFGESANTNEMCILAGIAYPATPGVDLGTKLESVL